MNVHFLKMIDKKIITFLESILNSVTKLTSNKENVTKSTRSVLLKCISSKNVQIFMRVSLNFFYKKSKIWFDFSKQIFLTFCLCHEVFFWTFIPLVLVLAHFPAVALVFAHWPLHVAIKKGKQVHSIGFLAFNLKLSNFN